MLKVINNKLWIDELGKHKCIVTRKVTFYEHQMTRNSKNKFEVEQSNKYLTLKMYNLRWKKLQVYQVNKKPKLKY